MLKQKPTTTMVLADTELRNLGDLDTTTGGIASELQLREEFV